MSRFQVSRIMYPESDDPAVVGLSHPARGLERIDHYLGAKGKARAWDVHAEVSAIVKADRVGIDLRGMTLYTEPRFPCSNCAFAIVEAGLYRVVAPRPDTDSYWYQDQSLAERILVCSGVEIEFL